MINDVYCGNQASRQTCIHDEVALFPRVQFVNDKSLSQGPHGFGSDLVTAHRVHGNTVYLQCPFHISNAIQIYSTETTND